MPTSLPQQPTLKELIRQLISCYQPVAEQHNSTFVEHVREDLGIYKSFEVVATLLGSLFYIVARCSNDTTIQVSASADNEITEIVLQASNPSSAYVVINQFEHLRLLSNKIGGVFHIIGNANGSEIVFNFQNKQSVSDWKTMLKAS